MIKLLILSLVIVLSLAASWAQAQGIDYISAGRLPDGCTTGQTATYSTTALAWTCSTGASLATNTFTGVQLFPSGTAIDPSITWAVDIDTGFFRPRANAIGISLAAGVKAEFNSTGTYYGLDLGSISAIFWGSSFGAPDMYLSRYGPGILGLNNGALDQSFRIYGFTNNDGANYHYGSFAMSDAALTIATQTLGTGVDNLDINIDPAGTGYVVLDPTETTATPAAGDCDAAGEAGRIVYDSTADNLYWCSGASGWRKIATAAP